MQVLSALRLKAKMKVTNLVVISSAKFYLFIEPKLTYKIILISGEPHSDSIFLYIMK